MLGSANSVFKLNKRRKSYERHGLASFLTGGKNTIIIADLISNESLIILSQKSVNTKFICEDCLKLLQRIKPSTEQITQSQDINKISRDTFQSRWKDAHVDVDPEPKDPCTCRQEEEAGHWCPFASHWDWQRQGYHCPIYITNQWD